MSKGELETVILRFRDLSIPDTIAEHQRFIAEKNSVWWGWWAKPQEKLPLTEFVQLKEYAEKDEGLTIILFDSGNYCIYKAICKKIHMEYGNICPSPDPERTPSYYGENKYMAWFEFSEISKAILGEDANRFLNKYTYYQVDDFFVSGKSSYTQFYGKKVFSVEELAEQQRTIWFVRKFKSGDKTHEIHSYNINNYKNVDQEFRLLASEDILWISDVHFSKDHHAFGPEPGNSNTLCNRLHTELNKRQNVKISHVIISGDLTFRASKDEFKLANDFIEDMSSVFGINSSCYSICPGNHDLKLSKNPYKPDQKVTIATDEAKKCYTDFYRKIYGIDPTEKLYSIRRVLTPSMLPVEIISVNSCLLQQGEHFMGMGFVGND